MPVPSSTLSAINKYLERHAETCVHQIPPALLQTHFDYVLVIPVYRERFEFVQRLLDSLLSQHACLLIVVINQPNHLSHTDTTNTQLWQKLLQLNSPHEIQRNRQGDQIFIKLKTPPKRQSALLLVDRFSPQLALPTAQGVGLARKIGTDIALSLISEKVIKNPWIWNSDADAHLPNDYFSSLDEQQNARTAAFIYPFRHRPGHETKGLERQQINAATQLYELSLNYYVAGLRWAKSPYAFHTLGSTLALNAEHYARVRGFPKRAGAEDFYLLNKLAKTGMAHTLLEPTIEIESRHSDRVPFGTGPAVAKLLELHDLSKAPLFYHPDIFSELKTWLGSLQKLTTTPLEELGLSSQTLTTLGQLKTSAAIEHAKRHSNTKKGFCKQMSIWFDGFRTLKFFHILRDQGMANITVDQARTTDFFST